MDLEKQELAGQAGQFSFFTLAFSSDSQKVLGIGGYAGFQLIDIHTKSVRKLTKLPAVQGRIGIGLHEKNGKLLIQSINKNFNPTLGDQIRVGDEVLALNEGEKSLRYDDSRQWKLIAGQPLNKALPTMAGMPGSWVQLRLARRGSSEPVEISVQRQWASGVKHPLPEQGECLTQAISNNIFQFRSADTQQLSSCISLRDIKANGQTAISPDAKHFAALARTVDRRHFCLEVHDLASGKLEQSAILETPNYRHLRFSPDSKQVLVGTRDTVEILDIATGEWRDSVVLTPPTEADTGQVVNRRLPLGYGLPGDLYTTRREVVYAKPAALLMFDVAPNGTLAIGSETGEIVLASLQSKERVGLVGDNILGSKPELIEFSPTGGHLVAFANGVLHIFKLGGAEDNPVGTFQQAAGGYFIGP